MAMIDLEPAANAVTGLLGAVTDEHLDRPTPSDIPVGALLDHMMNLSQAFTWGAQKSGPGGPPPAPPSADHLHADWRQKLPQQIAGLVKAWRAPSAWEGMAHVGGVTMPAEQMGVVALDELVLHGWIFTRALLVEPLQGRSGERGGGLVLHHRDGETRACRCPQRTLRARHRCTEGCIRLRPRAGLAGRDSAWKSPVRSVGSRRGVVWSSVSIARICTTGSVWTRSSVARSRRASRSAVRRWPRSRISPKRRGSTRCGSATTSSSPPTPARPIRSSTSPTAPRSAREPVFDPLAVMAWLGARTQRIRLGLSVLVVPYRNPVVTAKFFASLDVLTEGRIIIGAGVGVMEEEFEALDVPYKAAAR